MNLDLSQFKKIKEDKKSATLKHPQGHEITISKEVLSKRMKGELERLPAHYAGGGMGGTTEENVPEENDSGYGQAPERVARGASGSWDQPPQNNQPIINVNVGQPSQGPVQMGQTSGAGNSTIQDPNARQGAKEEAARAIDPNAQPQFPEPQRPQVQPSAPQSVPMQYADPAQNAQEKPITSMDPFEMYNQGMQMHGAGIAGEANAMAQQGRQQATEYQNQANTQQQLLNTFNQLSQPMMEERANLQKDMGNFHIDPKNYVKNMSTGSKIMSGLGIILGSMGQGLAGGNNPGMDFLNSQIEKDIDAQKAEFGKKKTMLEANYKNYGDMKTAIEMTHVMTGDILANHIAQINAQSQDPIAKARGAQLMGDLMQSGSDKVRANAMNKMLLDKMNAVGAQGQSGPQDKTAALIDYLRMNNPEMAKDYEKRYVPGVGLAQVEVPGDVRSRIIARQNLHSALEDLKSFSEENSGKVRLTDPAIVAQGASKARLVQDLYRQANSQGVFREAEKDFVEGVIDADPTKFFTSFRTIPKYKEAIRDNEMQLNGLKRGFGLPVLFKPKSAERYTGQ